MRTIRMFGFAAVALLALGVTSAFGQYPPPVGNVTVSVSDSHPAPNTTVTATVRIVDSQGRVAGGASCTASVSGGAGASVSPSSFTSNADGSFSLDIGTGSAAGSVTVSISCGGAGASATIAVGGGTEISIDSGVQDFWARAFGWLRHFHLG